MTGGNSGEGGSISAPCSHSGTQAVRGPTIYVTQWEAGGLSRDQIHERLKSLDLILRAGGISLLMPFVLFIARAV